VLTEWLVVMVGAVVVALLLRVFVLQAFWIPSESMEHTLDVDDRVLVNKLSYVVGDVSRGDIVVFRRPDDQPAEIRELIKRVIGVAGDVVEGRDNQVLVNGQAVAEPYLASDDGLTIASPSNDASSNDASLNDFGPVEVGEGQVFVMGDNRTESWDSRSFGPVSTDRIVGRAFVLFWPLGRADLL
jgi:signal peptidase I